MRTAQRLLLIAAVVVLAPAAAAADEVGRAGMRPADVLRSLSGPVPSPPAPALGFLPRHAHRFGWFLERHGHEEGAEDEVVALSLAARGWAEDHVRSMDDVRALARDHLQRVALDVEVTRPGGDTARARVVVLPGEERAWRDTSTMSVVLDYDPEVACDNSGGERPSVIGDPIPVVLEGGIVVAVRATPIDAGSQVRLAATVQVGAFDAPPPIPTRARYLGALTLPRYRGALLQASGVVAVGEALTSAVETSSGRYGLRIVPTVQGADDPLRRPPGVQWFGAGALVADRYGRRLDPATPEPLDLASWPSATARERDLDARSLREALRSLTPRADVEVDARGGVWVAGSPAARGTVARTLDAFQRAGGHLRLRVDVMADDTPLAHALLVARDGETALLRVGQDAAYLLDADVEVG